VQITTENGRSYHLSLSALSALQLARHAGEAEEAFEEFASHVPKKDRCAVWQAVPSQE
jgi:hypothetical protein